MTIQARDISKRFGEFTALDAIVSVRCADGSLTALLGPSGRRQVDAAACHRRARGARLRRSSSRART